MPHTIDAVSEPEKPLRALLLHNKTLHIILFSLLVTDGLIVLTSGVLETQFLHGKSDDCVAYVDKCVPIQAHRRLGEETWQDSFDSIMDHVPWPRFLSTTNTSHDNSSNTSGTGGHGSNAGTGSNAGHGSPAGHGSSAGIAGCGHVGQTEHFGNHDLHNAEVYLAYISCGILIAFFIEQVALIIEIRSEYCKPMFILDFFVITSSLILEIFVISNSTLSSGSGLLVMARTWRFARVGHGVIASQEEVEIVAQDDESFVALAELWAKIPDERWIEIAKKLSREDLIAKPLMKEELEVVETLGKSAHVTMRALAFSRMYQLHSEKKRANKAISSVALSQALGRGNSNKTVVEPLARDTPIGNPTL